MVQIRDVTDADRQLLWEWANDPAVRAAAFHTDPISWEDHVVWFSRKRADPRCTMYIIMSERGQALGQVRFDLQADGTADVDLSVAPQHRGRGYGAAALRHACRHLFEGRPVRRVMARVKPENAASLRTFEQAGFTYQGRENVWGIDAVRLVLNPLPADASSETREWATPSDS